jgi:hypothetical protein
LTTEGRPIELVYRPLGRQASYLVDYQLLGREMSR